MEGGTSGTAAIADLTGDDAMLPSNLNFRAPRYGEPRAEAESDFRELQDCSFGGRRFRRIEVLNGRRMIGRETRSSLASGHGMGSNRPGN